MAEAREIIADAIAHPEGMAFDVEPGARRGLWHAWQKDGTCIVSGFDAADRVLDALAAAGKVVVDAS